MSLLRITSLLEQCNTGDAPFPPTDLFNEGWLLRLVLDWYSRNTEVSSPLQFAPNARWFSEARLPSAFLKRHHKDRLAEGWTSADGVIGHFDLSHRKSGCKLQADARQFVVTEAKIFSKLSPGVTNAPYYDQAARNVACIAEVLKRAGRKPHLMDRIAFYVIAPKAQIEAGVFHPDITARSIAHKVKQRVDEYGGSKEQWHEQWFAPLLDHIEVSTLSWESLIDPIGDTDPASNAELQTFFSNCCKFNQQVVPRSATDKHRQTNTPKLLAEP